MMPDLQRRDLLGAAAIAALLPDMAWGQGHRVVIDGAGRRVTLPQQVERIYAAGPPASVLAFAVAPDKLIGWTSPFRESERPFVASRYADLPAYGRLIGLRWLARVLYPDVFSEDLRPIVRDFYNRFYHQSPTDAQLEQLLTNPHSAR